MYKFKSHIKLDVTPDNPSIFLELLTIHDYYGLKLRDSFPEYKKHYYFTHSLGHALRSYAPNKEYAYYIKQSPSLWIDKNYEQENKFFNTKTWGNCPATTKWITQKICSLKGLRMVSLHQLKKKGYTDWHSHYIFNEKIYPYQYGTVHMSLLTNKNDLCEVRSSGKIESINYKKMRCGFSIVICHIGQLITQMKIEYI